jgi:hypothetical protein
MADASCTAASGAGYAARRPEQTVLHRVLREHWPAFLERAGEAGGLPKFVTEEVEGYLRCGLPEHGCALLVCERCGKSLLVAFSCKRRGFCPSCCGRRMNDAALHLAERVFPEVPVRQWVCSFPFQLRYLLGYDRALCAAVLRAFAVELSRSYLRRAKRELSLPSVSVLHTGSVTFVQRVDSALRLNVHAHTLAIDGVYLRQGNKSAPETLTFLPLPEPTEQDVQQLCERTAARIERILRAQGRYLADEQADPQEDRLQLEEPALAACLMAAASGRALLGPEHEKPPLRVMAAPASATPARALCAVVRGVNIHASAAVPARDRKRLERLCRYAARPPLAQERLSVRADGRVRLDLKRPWADGTTAVVLSPQDFLARLCAAVPPPRFHLLRFHGVLAAHSSLRSFVVPQLPRPPAHDPTPQGQLPLFAPADTASSPPKPAPADQSASPRYKGRHPWALLLRHVFAVDVEQCARCEGRLRLLELGTSAEAIERVLRHAGPGPPPRAPPPLPAASPLQLWLPLHAS